jgi:hypothetical protein
MIKGGLVMVEDSDHLMYLRQDYEAMGLSGQELEDALTYTLEDEEMVELSETYQECPECHMKTLEVTAHCATCINCGYSLCGI